MKRAWLALILALAAFCLVIGCSDGEAETQPEAADDTGALLAAEGPIAQKLEELSLEEKVAQLFIVRPESIAPDDGDITVVDDIVREGLSANPPAGLCYFSENIRNPTQTRKLLDETQNIALAANGLPLIQSVDEEGGEVARVAGNSAMGVKDVGNMSRIGARGDAEKAYDAAAFISDYLIALGFNTDFAPVADIADGVGNSMSKRAFDSTAEGVAPMVQAAIRAFNEVGMLCSAKHFPGIGGAAGDSHYTIIETEKTLEELQESELIPFQAAIEAGVPMIMVGHIACPNVTGDDTPASLSPAIVTDLLREQMGFDGLIVTDSLEMGAVEDVNASEQGVRAIQAGCDLVLLPEDYQAAYQGVLDAVKSGEISEDEIDQHVARVLRVKLAWMGDMDSWGGQHDADDADAAASEDAATRMLDALGIQPGQEVEALSPSQWGDFFYYYDYNVSNWAQAFADRPATRFKVTSISSAGNVSASYRDPAIINSAFNALASLDMQGSAQASATDDSTRWTFIMDDGAEVWFDFTARKPQANGSLYTVDGNADFLAIEDVARENAQS